MTSKNQQDQHRQIQKDRLNNYARFTGVGFQMLVIIALGVYAGTKLDEHYANKYQAFTIICSFAAIGISLYSVISQVSKISRKQNKPK